MKIETYMHNGKELLHGSKTNNEELQVTRVDGFWYFHPTDPDWLMGNANNSFSQPYETEQQALEAAETELKLNYLVQNENTIEATFQLFQESGG